MPGSFSTPGVSDARLLAVETSNLGKADALVPTAVKTSGYTAAANDYVPVDTTSGAVTITLPTAPADKTRIGVKHVIQGGTNAVTIARGGSSDAFNKAGGSTSLSLPLLNQGFVLQYKASTGVWYAQSGDTPLSQLDARFAAVGTGAREVGTGNFALGTNALGARTTGTNLFAIGQNALGSAQDTITNMAIGTDALRLVNGVAAVANTAIGFSAGYSLTTGDHNVGVGHAVYRFVTTGTSNVAMGVYALGDTAAVINQNVAIGYYALRYTQSSGNVAVGTQALLNNSTGTSNVAVGTNALLLNTTGINNTSVGASALATNVGGQQCTAVGTNALNLSTVDYNTAIGASSQSKTSTGVRNTSVGASSLFNNTTGQQNAANGAFALLTNVSGSYNTAVGASALNSSTVDKNTAVGNTALYQTSTGPSNTAVGWQAGYNCTTGSNNVFIGADSGRADAVATTPGAITYATLIGAAAQSAINRAVVLGGSHSSNRASLFLGCAGTAANAGTTGVGALLSLGNVDTAPTTDHPAGALQWAAAGKWKWRHAAVSVGAAATDAATTQTLVNALRAELIALGLVA